MTFRGPRVVIDNASVLPKPVSKIPVMLGGGGSNLVSSTFPGERKLKSCAKQAEPDRAVTAKRARVILRAATVHLPISPEGRTAIAFVTILWNAETILAERHKGKSMIFAQKIRNRVNEGGLRSTVIA